LNSQINLGHFKPKGNLLSLSPDSSFMPDPHPKTPQLTYTAQ